MARTAEAIIVGGGITGTSIAYNIAARGVKNVMLIERNFLGSGGTGRSSALIRMHYSNEVTVRLALRSLYIFKNFETLIGGDAGFVSNGWLFIVPPENETALRENMVDLQALGVETTLLPLDEVGRLIPDMNVDGIAAAAYEPGSGYADPHGIVMGYAAKLRELGGAVELMTPVNAIRISNGRVAGVATNAHDIDAPIVVLATGPWTPKLLAPLRPENELPILVTREQDAVVRPRQAFRRPLLAVSDACDRIYFRPEAGGMILVGRGHPKESEIVDPDNFNEKSDFDFFAYVAEKLAYRFRNLHNAEILTGYAGLYDVTPDWNPVLDRVPGVEGLYCAVGFSGHGFKLAPAVGEVMAQLILDGRAVSIDISALSYRRFAEQRFLRGRYGGNRG